MVATFFFPHWWVHPGSSLRLSNRVCSRWVHVPQEAPDGAGPAAEERGVCAGASEGAERDQ